MKRIHIEPKIHLSLLTSDSLVQKISLQWHYYWSSEIRINEHWNSFFKTANLPKHGVSNRLIEVYRPFGSIYQYYQRQMHDNWCILWKIRANKDERPDDVEMWSEVQESSDRFSVASQFLNLKTYNSLTFGNCIWNSFFFKGKHDSGISKGLFKVELPNFWKHK